MGMVEVAGIEPASKIPPDCRNYDYADIMGAKPAKLKHAILMRLLDELIDAPALLQASCGLGVLAVLLHSWVDFNLRIPANAMLAAFLLGAFLRPLGQTPPEQGG